MSTLSAMDAYLFDMDGTLIDSTAVVDQVWTGFATRFGLEPAEVLAYVHGRPARDTFARFLPDRPQAERDTLLTEFVDAEVGLTDGITEIPGATAFLAQLPGPWAVVTSAPRRLALARLAAAGIPEPKVLVSADDVTNGKPDPEPYLLAAKLLDAPIEECLVFEDAEAGLRSAVASGARVTVVGTHESAVTAGLPRLVDYR